jgi:hypothetical protein
MNESTFIHDRCHVCEIFFNRLIYNFICYAQYKEGCHSSEQKDTILVDL